MLFDLDGVLVDSNSAAERRWHTWAQAHGLRSDDWFPRLHGLRSTEMIREVAPHLDADRESRAMDVERLKDAATMSPQPGARDLLHSLKPDAWGVVTSTGREVALARMRGAGLPTPGVLIAAEAVEVGKPAPASYLLAASRLSRRPSTCAVVEDSDAGVMAGLCAGMVVIQLAPAAPPGIQHRSEITAHARIDHLSELDGALQRLGYDHTPFG